MNLQERFNKLKAYYQHLERKARIRIPPKPYQRRTAVGDFLISDLDRIFAGFQHLREQGTIDPTKPFLDAGSGDGRILALASLFGMKCFGIEYDARLAAQTKGHLANLREQGVLDEDRMPVVVQGDFGKTETYKALGKGLSAFGFVYHYVSNEKLIAKMISRYAKPGMYFLLYTGSSAQRTFDTLQHKKKIRFTKGTPETTMFLHVYVKP